MQDLKQYIVVPKSRAKLEGNKLLEFLRFLKEKPDVSVEHIVGQSSNPRRLVIRGNDEAIKYLSSQFADQLIIELDSDLQMF